MATQNFRVKNGLEVGSNIVLNGATGIISATSVTVGGQPVGAGATVDVRTNSLVVLGVATATYFVGDGSGLTGVTATGSGIEVRDSGSVVGTAATVDFGDNLTLSAVSAGVVTVTASGGGGIAGIDTTGTSVFNQLNVSGVSTFAGITTVTGQTLFAKQLNVSGISTFGGALVSQVQNYNTIMSSAGFTADGPEGRYLVLAYQTNPNYILNNVGIGTTTSLHSPSKLNVKGGTSLDTLSVSGVSTFRDDLIFYDATNPVAMWDSSQSRFELDNNISIVFGNSSELQMYYLGPAAEESVIASYSNRPLNIKTSPLSSSVGGAITRLSITGAGVTVTGTTVTDQLSVSGVSTLGVTSITQLTAQSINCSGIVTSQNGRFSLGANNSYFEQGRLSLSGNTFWGDIYYSNPDFNFISSYTGIGVNYGIGDWIFQQRGSGGSLTEVARITGLAGNASFSGSLSASGNLNVSGVSTFTGAISCASTVSFGTTAYFGEDDEIVLNNKFKIYNNGSNTLLKNFDTNTGGDLYIQSDVILLQKYDGTETIARFTEGAGVELNYQGQTRLTTIDDGVIVGSNAAGVAHIPNELRIGTVAANQSNASIMIANSSGVGIGTTNPTGRLTVKGTSVLDNLTVSGVSTIGSVGVASTSLVVNGYARINGLIIKADSENYLQDSVIISTNPAVKYTGYGNVAIGANTLTTPGAAQRNVAIGLNAFNVLGNGNLISAFDGNTALGAYAGENCTTTLRNTLIGFNAGRYITTGDENVVLGGYGGNSIDLDIRTSNNNVVISDGAGNIRFYANSSGNVGLGTTNPTNTLTVGAVGSATTNLVVNGYATIDEVTISGKGYENTFIGEYLPPSNLTSGDSNVAIGAAALKSDTSGDGNVAIGRNALQVNTSSHGNTAVGFEAGYSNTGQYNIYFGAESGKSITSGSYNTIIGSYTGDQNGFDIRTSSNNVVLSDGAGNIRFYANSSGNVGFGTTNPTSKLSVFGGDISVGINTSNGLILTSPDGTRYRLIVDNNGALSTVSV